MHLSTVALTFAIVFFSVNFLCALLLHVHGQRQAHLQLRFLDVLVHFVLMSALALPLLFVTTAEAFFGGEQPQRSEI